MSAQQCIGDAEHCIRNVPSLTYNCAEHADLRISELSAIFSKRRIVMFVDSESFLSPSAFGATEVTFLTRQHFRVPRCLWTNGDDTGDDRRVHVDDGPDSAVVVVAGVDTGSGVLPPHC